MDDFLLFADSEEHLLDILRKLFTICRTRRLVVSLSKSEFFEKRLVGVAELSTTVAFASPPKTTLTLTTVIYRQISEIFESMCMK